MHVPPLVVEPLPGTLAMEILPGTVAMPGVPPPPPEAPPQPMHVPPLVVEPLPGTMAMEILPGTVAMPGVPPPMPPPFAPQTTQQLGMASAAIQNLEPLAHPAATRAMPLELDTSGLPPLVATQLQPRVAPPFADHPPRAPRHLWRYVLGGVGLLLLGGAVAYWLEPAWFGHSSLLPRMEPRAVDVPPSLAPLVERARTGDTKAMRQLGLSYAYGLDVKKDRNEARRWLRKAIAAGDAVAKAELERIDAEERS